MFYFVSLAAAMLYLNMVLLGRRHWAGGERSRGLAGHALARVVAVVVALAADVLIAPLRLRGRPQRRGAAHALARVVRADRQIPADRPVYIEAYYSEDVPREYVQAKVDLLDKLREFAAGRRAGSG